MQKCPRQDFLTLGGETNSRTGPTDPNARDIVGRSLSSSGASTKIDFSSS